MPCRDLSGLAGFSFRFCYPGPNSIKGPRIAVVFRCHFVIYYENIETFASTFLRVYYGGLSYSPKHTRSCALDTIKVSISCPLV